MSGRRMNWLWLPSLLGMLVAIPVALYGLMLLFGAIGRRVDGIVPLIVSVALVALCMRGLSATNASGRAPVRGSRSSRRAAWGVLGVFVLLVAFASWRAWAYQSRCDEARAALGDRVLIVEGMTPEPKAIAELGGSRRACGYEASAPANLVESRTQCRVGLEARIWRWLFWEASADADARHYVSVDDGARVELIFRR